MLLLHQVGCCTLLTNTYNERHFSSGPMESIEQQPLTLTLCEALFAPLRSQAGQDFLVMHLCCLGSDTLKQHFAAAYSFKMHHHHYASQALRRMTADSVSCKEHALYSAKKVLGKRATRCFLQVPCPYWWHCSSLQTMRCKRALQESCCSWPVAVSTIKMLSSQQVCFRVWQVTAPRCLPRCLVLSAADSIIASSFISGSDDIAVTNRALIAGPKACCRGIPCLLKE